TDPGSTTNPLNGRTPTGADGANIVRRGSVVDVRPLMDDQWTSDSARQSVEAHGHLAAGWAARLLGSVEARPGGRVSLATWILNSPPCFRRCPRGTSDLSKNSAAPTAKAP